MKVCILRFLCSLLLVLVAVPLCSAADKLYVANGSSATIQTTTLEGGSRTTIVENHTPLALAVDATHSKLYWTDNDAQSRTGSVVVSSLRGADAAVIIPSLIDPVGIAVSGDKIYYTIGTGIRIIKEADLDGSNPRELVGEASSPFDSSNPDGVFGPQWLAIDASRGKIYWNDEGARAIRRARLSDGSQVETVLTTANTEYPLSLTVDAENGYLYYCTTADVRRATINGTNDTQIATLDGSCSNIVLDPVNSYLVVTLSDAAYGALRINLSTKAGTELFAGEAMFGIATDAARPATPKTIPAPPSVTVQRRTVTLRMERFKFGAISARAASKNKKRSPTKYNVTYESETTRIKDAAGKKIKKEVTKRKDKRNVVTLKNVKSGTYTTHYRGVLSDKKSGKTISTTKFSPSEVFEVE